MSSIADARELAQSLDARLGTLVPVVEGSGIAFLQRLRGYLVKQDRRIGTRHNMEQIVKYDKGQDGTLEILLGPPIDKGDDGSFFNFPSGARLSFSIALRKRGHQCELISYRFQFTFPVHFSRETFTGIYPNRTPQQISFRSARRATRSHPSWDACALAMRSANADRGFG